MFKKNKNINFKTVVHRQTHRKSDASRKLRDVIQANGNHSANDIIRNYVGMEKVKTKLIFCLRSQARSEAVAYIS